MALKKGKGEKKELAKKEESTEEEKNKSAVKKEEKQLIWFLVIVALILGSFLGGYFYIQSLNKFEYAGIQFEKTREGDLLFYHGRFPLTKNGVIQNYYNIYLRNDPRENEIPIEADLRKINSINNITFSLEPDAGECYGAIIAQTEIGKFFGAPKRFNITSAVNDKETAKTLNLTYAGCENANKNQTVIIIKKSETPSIKQGDNSYCYLINVGECENIKTIERFIMGFLAQLSGNKLLN